MLIGKFYQSTIGKGISSIGAGLSAGNLSDGKVLRGLALTSMGLLGTSAMIRSITKSKDRLKRSRMGNNPYMQ